MKNSLVRHQIKYPVLVLVGPTAIGKTDLSLDLARTFNGEIISMDSMQVYRHMDIGTAKVTDKERDNIPHHLIDIVDPDKSYDAHRFTQDTLEALEEINNRQKLPIITGGTGLYLKALVEGLFDSISEYPDLREHFKGELDRLGSSKLHEHLSAIDGISASKIHINDTQRLLRALEIYHGTGVPWSEHLLLQKENKNTTWFTSLLQIGLSCKRKVLYERINRRTSIMINNGLIEEVKQLLLLGYSADLKSMSSIGYRHAVNFINKIWSRGKMEEILARDTRRYAKRQYTWFSKNKNIHWHEVADSDKIMRQVEHWLVNIHKNNAP